MNIPLTKTSTRKHFRSAAQAGLRPRLRLVVIAIGAIGSLCIGGGVFAAWTPTTSISSGSMAAANLAVTLVDVNGTTFNTAVPNLLPGDFLNRYADLTNTGSVSQTFSGTVTGSGSLGPAMTVKVDTCSVAWSANGTCSATTTAVLAATATSPAASVSFPALATNGVSHARFQFQLASNANQTTYQGTNTTEAVSLAGTATVAGGQDRTAS
jgi:hypothetical protein